MGRKSPTFASMAQGMPTIGKLPSKALMLAVNEIGLKLNPEDFGVEGRWA